jgi:hypothetical protein
MKLDALTSIKKDVLDTNALKSITGGRKRMTVSGANDFNNVHYSADRDYEVEFADADTGEIKWAYVARTHVND